MRVFLVVAMGVPLFCGGGRRSTVAVGAPVAPLPLHQVDIVNRPGRLASRPAHNEARISPDRFREPQQATSNNGDPPMYYSGFICHLQRRRNADETS